MRGPLKWLLVAAGIVVVILVTVAIGSRDKSDETVTAGQWAQAVCGPVGVWRGEIESIVEDLRTPPAKGATGTEEPQSETPQGRTGFVRTGLERAIRATETMIEGIDRAGTPDTPEGEQVADQISSWANGALNDLQQAEDSLDEEADTLEDSVDQLTSAARALATTMRSGLQVLGDAARADPELASALRDSSTCQQLREER